MLKTIVYGGIALAIFFTLVSTVIMVDFGKTYEYGWGTEPCMKTNGCTSTDTGDSQLNPYCLTKGSELACTTCNQTAGYTFFLANCHSLAPANVSGIQRSQSDAWQNSTHCMACDDFQFRSTARGMNLFVLVLGLVFISLLFYAYITKR